MKNLRLSSVYRLAIVLHLSCLTSLTVVSAPSGLSNDGTSRSDKRNTIDYPASLLKDFPAAQKVAWTVSQQAHKANFTENGLPVKAIYDNNGHLSYAIIQYNADQLPNKIVKDVNRNYRNFRISGGKKIIAHKGATFEIIIENEHSYHFLKVTDHDIEVTETLRKSQGS